MIEEIEQLGSELKPGPLPEGRSLEHGEIEVLEAVMAKCCIHTGFHFDSPILEERSSS